MTIIYKFLFKTKNYTKLKETLSDKDKKEDSIQKADSKQKSDLNSSDSQHSSYKDISNKISNSGFNSEKFGSERNISESKSGWNKDSEIGELEPMSGSKARRESNFIDDYQMNQNLNHAEKRNSLDQYNRRSSQLKVNQSSEKFDEFKSKKVGFESKENKVGSLHFGEESGETWKREDNPNFVRYHSMNIDPRKRRKEEANWSSRKGSGKISRSTERNQSDKSNRGKSRHSQKSRFGEMDKRETSVIGDESVDPEIVFQGKIKLCFG
jgi:hypothetical protein